MSITLTRSVAGVLLWVISFFSGAKPKCIDIVNVFSSMNFFLSLIQNMMYMIPFFFSLTWVSGPACAHLD
jgi:hypothetical protein